MTCIRPGQIADGDPLVVAAALGHPVDDDIIHHAILWRETLLDGLTQEIAMLQRLKARATHNGVSVRTEGVLRRDSRLVEDG